MPYILILHGDKWKDAKFIRFNSFLQILFLKKDCGFASVKFQNSVYDDPYTLVGNLFLISVYLKKKMETLGLNLKKKYCF